MKLVKKSNKYYVLQKNDRIILFMIGREIIESFSSMSDILKATYYKGIDDTLSDYELITDKQYEPVRFKGIIGFIKAQGRL